MIIPLPQFRKQTLSVEAQREYSERKSSSLEPRTSTPISSLTELRSSCFFFIWFFFFLQRIGLWVFIKYYHLLGEKFHDSQKGNNLFHFYDHLLHGAVQVVNSQCVNTLFNPSLQNHDSHVKQHDEQELHTRALA